VSLVQKKIRKNKGALGLLLPTISWLMIFFVIPILFILIVSFATRGEIGEVIYTFSFENYKRLFDLRYFEIFYKSIFISLSTTLFCLFFGYPFASFAAKASDRFRPILMLLIILPFWTNSLIRTYAWIILLRTEGVINSILLGIGLIREPLKLLYTNASVLVGMVYMMFPFMVLPLYTSIEKMEYSLIEASLDLGASPVKTFMKIQLPLTMPGIISGCLLVFVPTLGFFFIPDLMGGSKIVLMSNLIKNQFLTARDWPFGSSISVVLMIIMIILIAINFKLGGSEKGSVM